MNTAQPAPAKGVNVFLDRNRGRAHCRRQFMVTTLTTQLLTRASARVAIVPRGRGMSWQITKNYPLTGPQEKKI
jgi:hypothetical protein